MEAIVDLFLKGALMRRPGLPWATLSLRFRRNKTEQKRNKYLSLQSPESDL